MTDDFQKALAKAVYGELGAESYFPIRETPKGYVILERPPGDGSISFPFEFDRQRITFSGRSAVINGEVDIGIRNGLTTRGFRVTAVERTDTWLGYVCTSDRNVTLEANLGVVPTDFRSKGR